MEFDPRKTFERRKLELVQEIEKDGELSQHIFGGPSVKEINARCFKDRSSNVQKIKLN